MTPAKSDPATTLSRDLLNAFDNISGPHPGFRPTHAKGILLSGSFTPAASAATLTRAPHIQRQSTLVSVRFSDFGGIPAVPDNDPNASPRGIGIRFHLAEHVHTDIVAHSVDGFPARTAEEFLEFLQAAGASGPDAVKPTPIERFLATHPAALEFVVVSKPLPSSFAKESYFAVTAHKFTNQDGIARYGRYRVLPEGGNDYLSAEDAKATPANFLFDEIRERVAKGPVRLRISVQLAGPGDVVDDATIHWPADRQQVDFGTIEIDSIVADNDAEQRHIIFDPIPRVDGIDPSGDPLLSPRADVYLMSGRRRRSGR